MDKRIVDKRILKIVNKKVLVGYYKSLLKHAPPCNHPNCYNHISHPCEGCNRILGYLPEEEKIRILELIRNIEFPEKQYTKFTRFEIMDI